MTSEASPAGVKPETASLKTLLDRATAGASDEAVADATPRPAAEAATRSAAQAAQQPAAAEPPGPKDAAPVAATRAGIAPGETAPLDATGTPKPAEPNLDRMLREIFEGRPGATAGETQATPNAAAEPARPAASASASSLAKDTGAGEASPEPETDKKQSLLERLRVV
jgi:hypothetical protein